MYEEVEAAGDGEACMLILIVGDGMTRAAGEREVAGR